MIVEVNEAEFHQYLQEHERVAVFFHTPFCLNCSVARRMVETITQKVSFKGPVISANLNMMPSVAEPLNIMTVPLLLFVQHGEPVEHFTSFGRADELLYTFIRFFKQNSGK